jgi:predicted RNA binding protein YcfA (HicA-like mRNA interferase family)
MTKNDLMKLERENDFTHAIESMGYKMMTRKGGSHKVYKCENKPVLSVVVHGHGLVSIGVRRNIANLIFNSTSKK